MIFRSMGNIESIWKLKNEIAKSSKQSVCLTKITLEDCLLNFQ